MVHRHRLLLPRQPSTFYLLTQTSPHSISYTCSESPTRPSRCQTTPGRTRQPFASATTLRTIPGLSHLLTAGFKLPKAILLRPGGFRTPLAGDTCPPVAGLVQERPRQDQPVHTIASVMRPSMLSPLQTA